MNPPATTHQELLAASRAIAAQSGIQAITIRAVADRCGVAVGSVYHYFPSKVELLARTVEDIWGEILHAAGPCGPFDDFLQCIRWLFQGIQVGSTRYPGFLAGHAAAFIGGERTVGRVAMAGRMAHVRQGLLQALEGDGKVCAQRFDDAFTRRDLVEFVLGDLLALLTRGAQDCDTLCQVIARVIY